MKRYLAAVLIAATPLAAGAATESYTFDPTDTFANFIVDHFGITPIHGRFNKSAGKFSIDRAAKTASIEITIDTASIDTGDVERGNRPRSRDDHLRSADYFNVAEFPQITYKSTSVSFDGDTPKTIEGNLTLLGVTKPLQLVVERFRCLPPGAGLRKERCGGSARGQLKRSDFGMTRSIPAQSDEIVLVLAFGADKD